MPTYYSNSAKLLYFRMDKIENYVYATVVYNSTSFIPSVLHFAIFQRENSYSFILPIHSTCYSYLLSTTGGIDFSLLFFASEQRREDSKREKKKRIAPFLIPFTVDTDSREETAECVSCGSVSMCLLYIIY